MRALLISSIVLAFALPSSFGQSQTVFSGTPQIRINETGSGKTLTTAVTGQVAEGYRCVISKIGGKYYWASRENTEMLRIEGGAFITFVATSGSGHVCVIVPELKKFAALLGPAEKKFDYVEHLITGLSSVTYYGVSK